MDDQDEKYRQLEAIAQREFHLWDNIIRATVADVLDGAFAETVRESTDPHTPASESWGLSKHCFEEPALILPGVFVEHAPIGATITHVPASQDTVEQAEARIAQSEWIERGPENSDGCLAYRRAIVLGVGGRPVFISFDGFCADLFPPRYRTDCAQGHHYWFKTTQLSAPHPEALAVSACPLCGAFRPTDSRGDDIRDATPETLDWAIQRHRLSVALPATAYCGPHSERFADWLRDRGHEAWVAEDIGRAEPKFLHDESMDLSASLREGVDRRLDSLWKRFLTEPAEEDS